MAINQNDFLFNTNSLFIEEMYERYLEDNNSVPSEWASYFASFPQEREQNIKIIKGPSWSARTSAVVGVASNEEVSVKKSTSIDNSSALATYLLVEEFRINGHLLANLDPLGLEKRLTLEECRLDPKFYGFQASDMEKKVKNPVSKEAKELKLSELFDYLKKTYCSTIGYEFDHVYSMEERDWLFQAAESLESKRSALSKEDKKRFLQDLVEVEGMEQFIHSRFPGAKRFSVEGGESSVLATNEIILSASAGGVSEVIIGMAHRGRLNTLTKIMGKPYSELFAEFRGTGYSLGDDVNVSGDVKYHAGRSRDLVINGKDMHMSLVPNPSHLEAVNPVVQGKARAKQDLYKDANREKVSAILIHGDAAFAGQGVVPESLTLGVLAGYETGGIIHIVVNNQVGFTTGAHKARRSRYPTEVAKTIQAPIFHVNGNDVEAVMLVSRIAESYRQKFKKDAVIDIVCYRKYGHNEGDEPMFTQPVMYKTIKNLKSPAEIYADKLISGSIISQEDYKQIHGSFYNKLEQDYKKSETPEPSKAQWLEGKWSGIKAGQRQEVALVKTGVDKALLKEIGLNLCKIPAGYEFNNKIQRFLESRKASIESELDIDWGTAEALAYSSLLAEGIPVRISGQDAGRGTFSHRHSVLVDQNNENLYLPFNHVKDGQARYEVIDSNLSEYAVLGFEYGYSTVDPMALTIWEAQFGDFSNGAQIIIDQFISSGEEKWLRMSGLVMLLPHGFEGQGPEHSSARLERYLQLCAEGNMEVVNCTTPANFFHVLRRQIHREYRVPLIVMSPKSLLRHKMMVSKLDDFVANKAFLPVIEDNEVKSSEVTRVILCSGKVYFDLLEARKNNNIKDVALIRLEQYYPFPENILVDKLKDFKNAEFIWCQEEPRNMGAWNYLAHSYENVLIKSGVKNNRPTYVGRVRTASPATGFAKNHNKEQNEIIKQALRITGDKK